MYKTFDTAVCRFDSMRLAASLLIGLVLVACQPQQPADPDLYRAVDDVYAKVLEQAGHYSVVAEIDHSRLAAEAGEVMPPARVVLFSDPVVNSIILEQNPRAGLDLPFRVLVFANGGAPAVTFTASSFLQHRYALQDSDALAAFAASMADVTSAVGDVEVIPMDVPDLAEGDGVVILNSRYAFEPTLERLKAAILAESDTLWFGEIDYQAEAAELGPKLPPVTLLLFGAPGPGGKAMAGFPRMGLDAFCQKVLVYERPDGGVEVLLNDMTRFAQWHHGDSALPHQVINRRIRATLTGAVED